MDLYLEYLRKSRTDYDLNGSVEDSIAPQTFPYTETKIITPSKVYDPNDEFDQAYFEFSLFIGRKE